VIGDIFIDSETLLMIDFINLKIKSTQSFKYTHKNKMYIYIFIKNYSYIYKYLHRATNTRFEDLAFLARTAHFPVAKLSFCRASTNSRHTYHCSRACPCNAILRLGVHTWGLVWSLERTEHPMTQNRTPFGSPRVHERAPVL
jgi:hypothetical protein